MGQIVVAKFNEDISWTRDWANVIIYNKGIPDQRFINVENIGRESDTYLRYILTNYHNLPEKICFLQGNPFDHCEELDKYLNQNDSDFVEIGEWLVSDDLLGMPHHGKPIPIAETLNELGIKYEKETVEFIAGGQFIVNKKLITNKSFNWWENAYELHKKHPDSPWVFERIWRIIFNHVEND